MKKYILILALFILFSGCKKIGYKTFYHQTAPSKYPPTTEIVLFEYSNVDLNEIYEMLFSDFLIIGKSSFIGPYENPRQAIRYAKSIGTDIFISSSIFKETRTSFINLSLPTANSTYISGYGGNGPLYGTATTYQTQTTSIPIKINRYKQNGLFLKKMDNSVPLWERTKSQYKETAHSSITGKWKNENYQIDIFQSGDQIVAFIDEVLKGDKSWRPEQLKMLFGKDSKVGVYLMGNKTPIPSEFHVNKFGHLEIKLLTNSEIFSFARIQ